MAKSTVAVKFTGDTADLKRALNQADNGMAKIGNSTQGLGRKFSQLGKVAAVGVGGLVGGALAFATTKVIDFQGSMNTLRAVTNATGDQMAKVSDLAMKLGNDLTLPGTSAADAADAMTELAKGGLSITQSMGAAKGVLQLSAAAQIENAEAATITANALNAFSLEAGEAVRVSDLLAATSNASSAEITDVALAMQQAAAVFAAANVPIEDLTASIGLMANAGIKGSDAGTSLKTMLTRILTPASKKAKNAMDDLGVSVFDSDGNFIGMRETIKQFERGLKGMTQEQRISTLNTIFGSDAVRAANEVLGKGVGAWDEMAEAVTREGAAADLASAKMGGLGGALEGLKSVAETLALQLGLIIGPPLEALARWLAETLPAAVEAAKVAFAPLVESIQRVANEGLNGLTAWWEKHGGTLAGYWETFAKVATGSLGRVATFIQETVLPALGDFLGWFVENKTAVVAAIAAITAAFIAWAFSAAAAAVASLAAAWPLLLVAAAAAATAAILFTVSNRGEGVVQTFGRIAAATVTLGAGFVHLAALIGGAFGAIIGIFRTIGSLLNGLVNQVNRVIGLIDRIPAIPGGGGGVPLVPWFADGGVMPGPRGKHSLAMVAGGETILPTHKSTAPAAVTAAATGGVVVNVNIAVPPTMDAGAAGQAIVEALSAYVRRNSANDLRRIVGVA